MNSVSIEASPKQLAKLRNGHKVRVKPAMEGSGVCMIVRPETYDVVSRAFGRGKGVEVSLSPEEILANHQQAGQMEGKGIFGKKFDRFLERRGIKKLAYKVGDVLKGGVKQGIDFARSKAPELGARALRGLAEAVGRPELGTIAESVGRAGADYVAGKVAGRAKGYLDNPEGRGFVSNAGGPNAMVARSKSLAEAVEKNRALDMMNAVMGTNMGYMARSGLATADAGMKRANMIKAGVATATAGKGIGKGSSRRRLAGDMEELRQMRGSGGQVGAIGQAVLPPALQSQPYSENFQFQFTLPPAYQRMR